MAAPQLTFEPEAHAYELDGIKVPSVTQVLSFGRDLSRIPRYTGLFGTLVHRACEYDSIGELDESTLVAQEIDGHWCDPWPRLRAFRSHRERRGRQGVTVHLVEVPVWGEIEGLKYAGTIDLVWSTHEIDDIKTGAARPKEHGPQVQAYRHAYQQRFDKYVCEVGCIYLGDGRCERKTYNEAEHFETFRVALARYYEETAGR